MAKEKCRSSVPLFGDCHLFSRSAIPGGYELFPREKRLTVTSAHKHRGGEARYREQ
jgi:hypothetical protein